MNPEYAAFLASKAVRAKERGLAKVPELAPHLFPFQRMSVEANLRIGSGALFLDTGLGKTECQLEWCQKIIEATNKPALILTPLAVAGQTKRRGDRWGYATRIIRDQSDVVGKCINICNYDRIDRLDASAFGAVALDEASILKSFTGKTTRALIDMWCGARFKLCATATPAPNDHMELGQYGEFLDVMPSNEMLMRWFIADQTEMGRYRLKNHGKEAFWDWMSSWAMMAEKPSDITDNLADDAPYVLPPLETIRHRARDSKLDNELADLFGAPSLSATTMHNVKRQTIEARAEMAASILEQEPDRPWIIWCDTDYESDALQDAMPDAVDVRGSQSVDTKERRLEGFSTGKIKHLIGKPSMIGLGMDWSHCARQLFVGRSFSYETWYQAVRRCWRFGQKEAVKVHLVVAEGEGEIGRVIDRKADDHVSMKEEMVKASRRARGAASNRIAYNPTHTCEVPSWLQSAV